LIWRQANYDPLIGLPNRRLFRDRLEQEVKKAHRIDQRMGLLFLDLDRFKEINDSLGHDAGDILLVEAAKRITSCVRESDTVARLGGDEFTVILSEIEDTAVIERVAANLIEQMVQPFDLGGELVYISVSIGITVYPDDSNEVDELLKNADLAMYAAKNAGRNRFSYFTSATQKDAQQRLQMINDLRLALPAGQFSLSYQPIIDVRSQRICKAEALLRWEHPTHGAIAPADFIPRAEDSGLINEIGDWVFREAARVTKRWTGFAGDDFQISFNVSPVQFRTTNTCAKWLGYLNDLGVRGRNMTIEITEGLLLEASPRVIELVRQFHEAGVNIAIDDFGTGYSSLSYLKKFDIDYLKIDQSFVRDLATDSSDRALAETIVVMGHKLGLKVVAEGVETEQQRDILSNAGCDYAQGYLFSKPMPENEFEAMLLQQMASAVQA
jgi:diguanylate cyclase (GGDEF)-like protein